MKYDFDTLADRANSGNMKYLETPDAVLQAGGVSYCGAEMDFKTAPVIIAALKKKAENGLYGYTIPDDDYWNAILHWMKTRRDFEISKDWIVPTYGTLQSIAAAIRAFSVEGDGVVIQPPVYLLYSKVIERNQRSVVNNPLIYEAGSYRMDFAGLERAFAQKQTKIMILCNPHNPIGKVWDEETLAKVAKLANQYGILVISDEIFAEIVFDHHHTVPYMKVPGAEQHAIVATSLGKVFNFTGFAHSNIIIASEPIRKLFVKQREVDHYGSINPFLRAALVAAYEQGGDWVDEMLAYVNVNVNLVKDFFKKHLPKVNIAELQGTYLIWIDWNGLGLNEDELIGFLKGEALLDMDRGSLFGEGGEGFTRMNLATPRKQLEESLERLLHAADRRGFTTSIQRGSVI
ncbi:MalY/PatB family protein [Paenibacillus senegalensis]|uniref:MalY/PatB family protein n=1 Tax=Paenibacillus senegalensis TaxID=1465766 RepID=UPI000287F9D3|nr:PatB family C-S lyase [Paenibacillus senegalensis]